MTINFLSVFIILSIIICAEIYIRILDKSNKSYKKKKYIFFTVVICAGSVPMLLIGGKFIDTDLLSVLLSIFSFIYFSVLRKINFEKNNNI